MADPQKPPYPLYEDRHNEEQNSDKYCFKKGFKSVIDLLKHKKNILVLAGAGISVSCGLPDFRSKKTGLYSTLDTHELGLTSPEELFDIQIFQDDPRPFYKFAKQSSFFSTGTDKKESKIQPSTSHFFLAWLQQTNRLLRVYTQNIDGLEECAGVSPNRIVYAHGSIRWAQCMKCGAKLDTSELLDDVMANKVPLCKKLVIQKNHIKQASRPNIHNNHSGTSNANSFNDNNNNNGISRRKGTKNVAKEKKEKTSTITNPYKLRHRKPRNNSKNDNVFSWEKEKAAYFKNNEMNGKYDYCGGIMKPGITFFGEKLKDQVSKCMNKDYFKADALLVIGTFLSVIPMSKMIHYFPPSIPRFLINQNLVQPPNLSTKEETKKNISQEFDDKKDNIDFRNGYVFDACLLGFCDDITSTIWDSLVTPTSDNKHKRKKQKLDQNYAAIAQRPISTEAMEGKLLCNIIENEKMNVNENHEDNSLSYKCTTYKNDDGNSGNKKYQVYHHPTNRIFLFRGAIMNKIETCDEITADHVQREIALCDGCDKEIGGTIMKCSLCFDFDLCLKCYPTVSRHHFGGKHTFIPEEQDFSQYTF